MIAKTERPSADESGAATRAREAIAAFTIASQNQLAFARVLADSFLEFHPESSFTIFVANKKSLREKHGALELCGFDEIGLSAVQARTWPMIYDSERLCEEARRPALEKIRREHRALTPEYFAPQLQIFAALDPLDDAETDLGHWNLNPAELRWLRDHFEYRGAPLRAFDFSGYDPERPHLLSEEQGIAPKLLLTEWPALAKLCEQYRKRVLDAGFAKSKNARSDFAALPSGAPIDLHMQRTYCEAYKFYENGEGPEPPSPFAPEGEKEFVRWLTESIARDTTPVTRYMMAVYAQRTDVQQAYPDALGADAKAFREWILNYGRKEIELNDAFLGETLSAEVPSPQPVTLPSVSIAGYLRAELGMGEAARLIVSAFEAAELSFRTVSYRRTISRQDHPFEERKSESSSDINLICVNADQIPGFTNAIGPEFLRGRYAIGMWAWEVEDFPAIYHGAFKYVDEIWVASEFIRQSLAKVSPKPIFKFPLPVLRPAVHPKISRRALGLPEGYIFLFSFDFLSVLERKNPLGLVEAFQKAFRPNEGPQLVIKTINGDKRVLELEKLRFATRRRSDIHLIDGYLSVSEKNALTAHCDCYVSLHRAEGYGLTMAEAMALGKPVIATGYSGNLDFMTTDNSYLCSFVRTNVGPYCEPYPPDSTWSEPDVNDAARLIRHVYENQEEARHRGAEAAQDMQQMHSPNVAGAAIRKRIETIRQRRAPDARNPSLFVLQDRVEELEAENLALRRELDALKSSSRA